MSKLSECFSIDDLHQLAKTKLPSVIYDLLEGAAEDELTKEWNCTSFRKYEFVPRVLRDVSNIDLSVQVQGVDLGIPIISPPTGMSRMFHHDGERAVVRASHNAGAAYALSTVSTCSIEEVTAYHISQHQLFLTLLVTDTKGNTL